MCEFGKIRAISDNVAQICFVKNIKMQVVGWKISERKNSLDDYFSVCLAGPRRQNEVKYILSCEVQNDSKMQFYV